MPPERPEGPRRPRSRPGGKPGGKPPQHGHRTAAGASSQEGRTQKGHKERPQRSRQDHRETGRKLSQHQHAEDAGPARIAKLLARAGVASRRGVERLLAEGRIALHGEVLQSPATLLASLEGVTVDGKPVPEVETSRVFLFFKPSGFLTTAHDPAGRPTIYDILPGGLPRLMPVGRLDYNTEGLLLLTNDGGLKRQLELPASHISRTYRIRAFGRVEQRALEALALGMTVEGMRYGPIDASIERHRTADAANIWLRMTLMEGKNREVRKVCKAIGLTVSRLIRTSYGPFALGELRPREIVEAPASDVRLLKRSLKGTAGEKKA